MKHSTSISCISLLLKWSLEMAGFLQIHFFVFEDHITTKPIQS